MCYFQCRSCIHSAAYATTAVAKFSPRTVARSQLLVRLIFQAFQSPVAAEIGHQRSDAIIGGQRFLAFEVTGAVAHKSKSVGVKKVENVKVDMSSNVTLI